AKKGQNPTSTSFVICDLNAMGYPIPMSEILLVKNVRPLGAATTDILVEDGIIRQMSPDLELSNSDGNTTVIDGKNQMVFPGLVNAHAHIDKNLIGQPWHRNALPGATIRDLVDYERKIQSEQNLSTRTQSNLDVEASIAAGTTHIRTHVDIDPEIGLTGFEGVLGTKEEFKNKLTMQTVAFPQRGMLINPGTVELLEEALKMGADAMGGLDPSIIDRDPAQHINIVFDLAIKYGVEVDIHLHEPRLLGAFSVELIIERTKALSMQGNVTISHVFCLGMIEDGHLNRLIDQFLENDITIMSLASGSGDFPPLKKLNDAGVKLCTGTDGVRDTWGPYNYVDILERVKLMGYRSGFRRDEDVEMLLNVATYGGAAVMKDNSYGLEVGKSADFVILPGDAPTQAVVELPTRSWVIKRGKVVAKNGELAG
ncbi:MAG: amidohydrolase, partial [Chloroflexota bacterium]